MTRAGTQLKKALNEVVRFTRGKTSMVMTRVYFGYALINPSDPVHPPYFAVDRKDAVKAKNMINGAYPVSSKKAMVRPARLLWSAWVSINSRR